MAHKWEGKLNSQDQGLREQGRGARATHPCEGGYVLLMGAKCTPDGQAQAHPATGQLGMIWNPSAQEPRAGGD